MDAALLTTKLQLPSPRPTLVARSQLIERLHHALRGKLTVLAAPAGCGKTTLLAQALAHTRATDPAVGDASFRADIAWVTLDANDNDPIRFWSYVLAGVGAHAPELAEAAGLLLRAPQPPPIETILTTLLNGVQQLVLDVVLVLEDYHSIDAPAIHAALAFVLDHLPPRLHLVIASRVDPPLPLARLRARGELTELRAADLRFTHAEAATFLHTVMELDVSAAESAALEERTEGWIAGLQLAALAMRDHHDRSGFIRAFTGSHRFVVDYLADEVFAGQPPHIQQFLLSTAILDRMCGALCDAVLGIVDEPSTAAGTSNSYSQLLLEQVEQRNLFLVALDDERCWYRYHQLFGDVLRNRLLSGAPTDAVRALYERASGWFERHGWLSEAIDAALRATAWQRACELIENHAIAMILRREVATLNGWLHALPAEVRDSRPRLLIAQAWEQLLATRFDTLAPLLDQASKTLHGVSDRGASYVQHEIDVLHAVALVFNGDAHAVERVHQAVAALPPSHPAHTALAAWLSYAYLTVGDVRAAATTLEAALAAQEPPPRLVQIGLLTILGFVRFAQGRLNESLRLSTAALGLAEFNGALLPLSSVLLALLGRGQVYLHHNNLAAAERSFADCLTLAEQGHNRQFMLAARFWLARADAARGDPMGALARMDAILDAAAHHGVPDHWIREMEGWRTLLWLDRGDLAAARRWAARTAGTDRDRSLTPYDADHIARACVLLVDERWTEARAALQNLQQVAERTGQGGFALWALLLHARLYHGQHDLAAARAVVDRAVTLAQPEGYVRIFVEQGTPIAELLQQLQVAGTPRYGYVATLLDAFQHAAVPRAPHQVQLVEPLSERELEVLRLVAAGLSNQQIAGQLIVALSTVKKHVNNAYAKLEVESRTQALARAKELGLLP